MTPFQITISILVVNLIAIIYVVWHSVRDHGYHWVFILIFILMMSIFALYTYLTLLEISRPLILKQPSPTSEREPDCGVEEP